MPNAEAPARLPQKHTFKRYLPIVCTFIIGVAASFYMSLMVHDFRHTKLRTEFESRAKGYSNAVQNTLNEYIGIPEFIKDFYDHSQNVTRKEFFSFTTRTLSRYPGVQALGWDPLVKDQDRPVYESEARAEGFKDFMFTERSNSGKLVQAGKRAEYVVVYFIEPLEKNRPALGFDIASNPVRREAIESAFDTGKPVATARITLVQETGHQFGTLILNPIYQNNAPINTIEDRRKNRKGLVVAVLRIGDTVEEALKGFTDKDIILYLYDVTSQNGNQFLYTRPLPNPEVSEPPANAAALENGLHLTTDFDFAGRQWKFILVPSGLYLESHNHWAKWLVLSGGLFLTALLLIYLLNRLRYTDEIEKRIHHETIAKELLAKEVIDRKSAQETSAHFGNILEQSLNEIYVFNAQTLKLILVNRGGRHNLGYSMKEFTQSTFLDINPEYTSESFAAIVRPLRTGEQDVVLFNTVHKRKDATRYDVEVHLQMMEFQSDSVFVAIVIDITEKLKTEKNLHQSQKMESIGTLSGGIAYDFNNILASIIGYTELVLADVEKGSLIEENLQEVLKGGERARDLVKQILTFARQGEKGLSPIRVSLIAKEALKLIRSTIPTFIQIEQNIVSESSIMGDTTEIHQIFMNLYTNAAQAMEDEGGVLKVSLTDVRLDASFSGIQNTLKPGNYLELIVSDTGTGISPDVIQSIFEPYYTTKEFGKGTGMGLAMVHGIVKSHGGEIAVESEVGKGTVFRIYLPVTKKDAESIEFKTDDLPTGTEQILFVDDELSIENMARQMLERLGYTVTIRTSSIEALALFRNKPDRFDLVITDMAMPLMTGDKFTVELMKIRSDIPVILCTGYSKKISEEQAFEIGIKAYSMKPLGMRDLANTVRKVLDEVKDSTQD